MSSNRIEIGSINAPELVLVQDASDNLVIEDTDGNTIVRFNQDQTTDFFADLVDGPNSSVVYDQSAEEVTADVNNSSTVTGSLAFANTAFEDADFVPIGPTYGPMSRDTSTSSQTYQSDTQWHFWRLQWDEIIPSDMTGGIRATVDPQDAQASVRLQNTTDGETIFEQETSVNLFKDVTTYTPTTTGGTITVLWQLKSGDGSSVSARFPSFQPVVQL